MTLHYSTYQEVHSRNLISGDEWKEQRRFALKHLRDFGFGKSSMEDIIQEEFIQLGEKFKENNVKEVDSHQLFNLMVINVLWGIVAGKRYNIKSILPHKLLCISIPIRHFYPSLKQSESLNQNIFI
jgi:hypothetical protein